MGGREASQLIEIQAVGMTTSKQLGEAAEAAFPSKASGLGFAVSKPWEDSRCYDVVVDSRHGFWRVQIRGGACWIVRAKPAAGKTFPRSVAAKTSPGAQGPGRAHPWPLLGAAPR